MDVFTVEEGITTDQYFAPDWQGTFALTQELPHRIAIDLTGQWYGPMRLPVQPNDFRPAYSPWYALLNVQVRHWFSDRFEVFGGVKNLLDFVPQDPLMRPFDPFDRTAGDLVSNPNGHTFDTAYMYAPLQGIRGFLGLRMTLE
jgi:outer membrane receptor for ferrienterochelin and colicins